MGKVKLTREEKTKLSLNDLFIEYCRANPVYAAQVILNLELVWYQRLTLRWLWKYPFCLLVWGRGIGKTYMGAVFCVLYAILYPGTKIGVIGPVFRQAEFMFDVIEDFYDNSPYFKACVKGKKVLRSPSRAFVQLLNGSFIEALPLGNGSKVRGRRYHVAWIDEYAQVPEDIIKLVITPMLAIKKRDYQNRVIRSSSAFYTWNHLYHKYLLFKLREMTGSTLYKVSEFNFEDLQKIKDPPYAADMNIVEESRSSMTDEEFAMEWLGRFPTGGSGFITGKLIEQCTPKKNEGSPIEMEGRRDREYVLGIDAARVQGGDDFCIQIMRLDGDRVKRLVRCITMNGATFPDMAAVIRQVILKYNVVRIFLDTQGGGMAIYDLLSIPWINPETNKEMLPILDMEDKANESKDGLKYLKLIRPTRPLNNDIFNGLKAEMQHNRLFFPITFRKSDLSELETAYTEIQQTKSQLMLLIAEGKGAYLYFDVPTGKKMDRAYALALANAAAKDVLGIPERKMVELPTENCGWVEIGEPLA